MKVTEQIKNLDDYNLVELHNAYCESNNSIDDTIHLNDEEFFELYFPKTIDAIRACHFGSYEWNHDFVQFNGYANLETFDRPLERVDVEELAEWVKENDNHSDYELEETRDCEITGEEISEGYYFEYQGIWIAKKEDAIAYIKEHHMDELEEEEHEDIDDLMQDAYGSEVCMWTTVD